MWSTLLSQVVPLSWGLLAFFVTLWHAVIISTFSSVLSLSPLHAQRRGISWQGARDAVSGRGWGKGRGRRCQSSYRYMPVTQTVSVERVMFEPGAHPPVSALFCQSPFNSGQCHQPCLPSGHTLPARYPHLTQMSPHPSGCLPLAPLAPTSGASQSHLSQC